MSEIKECDLSSNDAAKIYMREHPEEFSETDINKASRFMREMEISSTHKTTWENVKKWGIESKPEKEYWCANKAKFLGQLPDLKTDEIYDVSFLVGFHELYYIINGIRYPVWYFEPIKEELTEQVE